jgi:2-polyprenyl-6-methoxyphenol hydroxylase-like FAD-dependent oxidoreductase
MCSHQPRIAIIGAGPAGLTAGVVLHKHGIPFSIFELRQKPTVEDLAQPTGMLDLHEETGLAAIHKCDLYNEFLPLTGDCAQVMRIADQDGNIVCTTPEHGEDRPEISRHDLNQLLISKLPAESIRWGHKLLSAQSSTASGHTVVELDFGKHGKQTFELVIGADGAWSKVRNLLTDTKPQYSGRQIITVTIKDITKKYPQLADLVGPGTFFALGNSHGVSAQRGSQDSERFYIFITTPDENFPTTCGLDGKSAVDAKDTLFGDNALLGQWGSKTKELVNVACEEDSAENSKNNVDIRPVFGFPPGHAWEHKSGATLIGDAAHLMPPSGEGVNIAMWDAVLLSEAIIKALKSDADNVASFQRAVTPLIEAFEKEMTLRATAAANDAQKLNDTLFAENAATAMAEWFKSFEPPPE